jgi:hypothetical protein
MDHKPQSRPKYQTGKKKPADPHGGLAQVP